MSCRLHRAKGVRPYRGACIGHALSRMRIRPAPTSITTPPPLHLPSHHHPFICRLTSKPVRDERRWRPERTSATCCPCWLTWPSARPASLRSGGSTATSPSAGRSLTSSSRSAPAMPLASGESIEQPSEWLVAGHESTPRPALSTLTDLFLPVLLLLLPILLLLSAVLVVRARPGSCWTCRAPSSTASSRRTSSCPACCPSSSPTPPGSPGT